MDVLLINPPPPSYEPGRGDSDIIISVPPLGLAYIAAVLEEDGFTVRLACMPGERLKRADLEALLRREQPQLIGITSMVNTYNNGLRIASIARRLCPGAAIVMGGPHASFLGEETLAGGQVDAVCRFEGELTMLELARHYLRGEGRLEEIRGIVYRKDGRTKATPERPFIEDLDELPLPARHLLQLESYQYPGSVITGRGCPFNCAFCAANAISGSRCRMRSTKAVLEELEEIYRRYGLAKIFFLDDTFTVSKARVWEICAGIAERKLPLEWYCESRVNTVDAELLDVMYEAGCRVIQFGVESGNDGILKKINKGISTGQVEQAVETALKRGVKVFCSMIIGHPDDTHETVRDTIRLGEKLLHMAKKLGTVLRISFPVLTPLPGTRVYEDAEDLGLRFLSRNWDRYNFMEPVIETRRLTREDLQNYMMDACLRCPEEAGSGAF